MRRRERAIATNIPKALGVFVSQNWSGVDEAMRYSGWIRAREEWKTKHGISSLPDDLAAWESFPDGLFREEEI